MRDDDYTVMTSKPQSDWPTHLATIISMMLFVLGLVFGVVMLVAALFERLVTR